MTYTISALNLIGPAKQHDLYYKFIYLDTRYQATLKLIKVI